MVEEPKINDVWNCPRCKQYHCGECVETHKVDFKIMDEAEDYPHKIQWENELVCPWCYNQLVELIPNDS